MVLCSAAFVMRRAGRGRRDARPRPAHHPASAVAASSSGATTSTCFSAGDAWLASRVTTLRALVRADLRCRFSGAIIRSALEIGYHDGFTRHAGSPIVDANLPTSAWTARHATPPRRGRRAARRTKKDARCTQRARIPVKEVSHELRVQIKEIARHGQRIDCNIDMTGPAHAGTSRVAQWMPPPPDAMPRMSTCTIARLPAYGRMAAMAAASAAESLNFGITIAPLHV